MDKNALEVLGSAFSLPEQDMKQLTPQKYYVSEVAKQQLHKRETGRYFIF